MNRRRFAQHCLASAAATSFASGSTAHAEPASITPDIMTFVNPELRPTATSVRQVMASMPPLSEATLAHMREGIPGMAIPPALPNVAHEIRTIVGPKGEALRILVVNAQRGQARPVIIHMHGGGFVSGKLEWGVRDLQEISSALNCCAVSIDYRLAPETRYAGSIEDNYAGLKWAHAHASELGVDPSRIAVMGESAGGGHAALLALTARDRGEIALAFQVLIYPMLDDRTGSSRRLPPQFGALTWTPQSNQFSWRSFLGVEPGGRSAPTGAVPARCTDLSRLPPAFIGVGSIDLFAEEDIEYARRLIDAGVPTELVVVPGAFHGFDGIAKSTHIAQDFTAAKITALRRAFYGVEAAAPGR